MEHQSHPGTGLSAEEEEISKAQFPNFKKGGFRGLVRSLGEYGSCTQVRGPQTQKSMGLQTSDATLEPLSLKFPP